jgi:hypothetical protein
VVNLINNGLLRQNYKIVLEQATRGREMSNRFINLVEKVLGRVFLTSLPKNPPFKK